MSGREALVAIGRRSLRAPRAATAPPFGGLFRAAATAPPPSPPPNQDWLDGHLATPQGGVNAGMGLPARQRRILFRARQRGWLELDVLLGRWAAKHVAELRDEVAVARVEALLEAETPHLYEWIVGISEPPPPYTDCEALRSLQEFAGGHGVVGRR